MTATAYSKNDLSDTQGSAIFKGDGGGGRFRKKIPIPYRNYNLFSLLL